MKPIQVLIINHPPDNQGAYPDFLKIHDMEVRSVISGSEALAVLADRDFDAVVIDIIGPIQTVIDLISQIKKSHPSCCILALSNDPTPSLIQNIINQGADGCLIKPFLQISLLDAIQKGVERMALTSENQELKNELYALKRDHIFLKETYEQVKKRLIHDPVSGVLNQNSLIRRLESEIKRAMRYEHWLSLVLFHYQCNEEIPSNPQEVLKSLSQFLLQNIRSMDIVGHHKEGFAVILPETDENGAAVLSHRLRESVMKPFTLFNQKKDMNETIDLSKFQDHVSISSSTYPIDSHLTKKLIHIAESRLETEFFSV